VDAVDTVGAGDAFNGALAVALAEGKAVEDAIAFANAAAAVSVTRPGAAASMGRRAEVEALIAAQPRQGAGA
jgi:ribokinase